MTLTESQVLSKRDREERKIVPFFEEHAKTLYEIVKDIIKRFQDGDINRDEAYNEILDRTSKEIAGSSAEIDALVDKYAIGMYQIGKEIAEEDRKLNAFDVLFLSVMFKMMRNYIYNAQKDILGKAVTKIRDHTFESPAKTITLEFMSDRFYKIIVSEGSRQLTQGTIQVAISNGLMLIYHTMEDERVCQECFPYNDRTFFPHDVLGLLPIHTHCRCYFEIFKVEKE